jgi:hypothetical protein
MSQCKNCGVELDEEFVNCPLCGSVIGREESPTLRNRSEEHYPSDTIVVHKKEKRRHIWELSGIIAFSGIVVCTIVNFVIFKRLTWSLYADTSILLIWICITLILLSFRNYTVILPGMLLAILSALFLYDMFSPPLDWFLGIGLPVTVALSVAVSIIILLWNIAHFKGFNILAVSFLILSVFCLVSEIFIDNYVFSKVNIHWSAIVAVSVFPISLFLLFVHYRMRKGNRLDSYFHV